MSPTLWKTIAMATLAAGLAGVRPATAEEPGLGCYAALALELERGTIIETAVIAGEPGLVVDEYLWRDMAFTDKRALVETFVCGMRELHEPVHLERVAIFSDLTHHRLGTWSAAEGLAVSP